MTSTKAIYDDPQPAEFRARLDRGARPLGRLRAVQHRGRRIAALTAAVAVPAMAAPADWSAFEREEAAALAPRVQAMGFERQGESFPGSAFYYLEDLPQAAAVLPALDPSATDAASARLVETRSAGPSARAFLAATGGLDHSRALRCLTMAVYYEAASESLAGQQAVAQVVLNRVAHPTWPATVCGVVFEGSERRTGCQFSFTCDGSLARTPSRKAWDRAQGVASAALGGHVYAPIGLATHYHTNWVNPYWASSLDLVGVIGAHRFYRWRGKAGQPAAFRVAYSGFEPVAARRPVAATPDLPAVLPTTNVPAYIAPVAPQNPVAPAPRPETAPRSEGPLAGSGQIKERYANVGKWIAQPGAN